MPPHSQALTRTKPTAGTREGNGRAILPGVDGRSWGARRYRELCADHAEHLGGDVTAPQEAIIRRAAQLQTWCEEAEAAFARGEAFDVAVYTTAANSLRRLLTDIGLERRSRDITPSLETYIAAQREAVS